MYVVAEYFGHIDHAPEWTRTVTPLVDDPEWRGYTGVLVLQFDGGNYLVAQESVGELEADAYEGDFLQALERRVQDKLLGSIRRHLFA